MSKNVLFIGAHPDDIEMSCGGTVSNFVRKGHNITWVVFSDCNRSLPEGQEGRLIKELFKSSNSFGDIKLISLDYPVRDFSSLRSEILQELFNLRKEINPDIVFCHNPRDIHQDHSIIGQESIRAFNRNSSVLFYGSSYNLPVIHNNVYVSLSEADINTKMNSLRCYQSQYELKRNYFDRDYIVGDCKIHGIESGLEYAEAFEPFKYII